MHKRTASGKVLCNKCTIKNDFMSSQQLAKEWHNPIIIKCEKREVHSSFKGNIWAADLADVQLVRKYNEIFWLFYMTATYLVNGFLLRHKSALKKLMLFKKFLISLIRKSSIIVVGKDSEMCNKSMKSWLQNNDIEKHSKHSEKRFFVAERFIEPKRTRFTNIWLRKPKMDILINLQLYMI